MHTDAARSFVAWLRKASASSTGPKSSAARYGVSGSDEPWVSWRVSSDWKCCVCCVCGKRRFVESFASGISFDVILVCISGEQPQGGSAFSTVWLGLVKPPCLIV